MSYFMMSAVSRRSIRHQQQVPPSIITPPSRWIRLGDSQTGGRATETPTAVSPIVALDNLWAENGFSPASPSTTTSGVSGRSLAGTRTSYEGMMITSTPWVHVQESGNQDLDGQRTAADFGATFQAFMEKIHTDWPDALITYETAFSFGREADAYRNWTSYNTELLARVATLASAGITVHVVDTDAHVKALQSILTPAAVWYQSGETNAYHYTGIGNFLIAMAMLQALGHNVATIAHTSISDLSGVDKAAAIEVLT